MVESSRANRSCSRRSTAISASLTGDDSNFVQLRIGRPNIDSASAPASRTLAAIRAAASSRSAASLAGNGHTLDPQRRGIGPVAEHKVVSWYEARKHFRQMSGDRDFADRIGALAILDPEA